MIVEGLTVDLFAVSVAVLWGVVFFQTLILAWALRQWGRMLSLKRSVEESLKAQAEALGPVPPRQLEDAPAFATSVLATGATFRTADLKGQPAALVFLSKADADAGAAKLATAIHGIWHKANKRMYLLCQGTEEECRLLVPALGLRGPLAAVPVLLDPGGAIARAFAVNRTPAGLRLDAFARIEQVGMPMPGGTASDDDAAPSSGVSQPVVEVSAR